jgi:transposase
MKTISLNKVKQNLKLANRTYVHNRGTSSQRMPKAQCLSERLNIQNETKKTLVSLVNPINSELADRIKRCGAKFSTVTCGSHIVQRKPHDKCDFRHCPTCAARKSREYLEKYLPFIVAFPKYSSVPVTACHLVLTLKHRVETAKQSYKRFMGAFRKLVRRDSKIWNEYFLGGLYKIEQTLGTDNLWHTHAHIICFRRRFFDIELLRSEWLKVTGDSFDVYLEQIDDVRSGLVEAVKYTTKPSDIARFDVSQMRELLELKGQRMIGTFGEFRDFCRDYKPVDDPELTERRCEYYEGDACPVCSEPLFEVILSVSELIRHARRIEAVPKLSSCPSG